MVTHWEAHNLNTKTNVIFHIPRNNKNKMSLNVPSATDGILWNGPYIYQNLANYNKISHLNKGFKKMNWSEVEVYRVQEMLTWAKYCKTVVKYM